MNDVATLTAKPKPLTVDGKTYLVHPFTIADFGDLQAWVWAQYPDPLPAIAQQLEGLPPALQKHAITAAVDASTRPKPRLGMAEADELVRSFDGIKEMLYLSIRKGDPTFSRKDAVTLFGKLGTADLAVLMKSTGAESVLSDPKAEAGPEPTTPT